MTVSQFTGNKQPDDLSYADTGLLLSDSSWIESQLSVETALIVGRQPLLRRWAEGLINNEEQERRLLGYPSFRDLTAAGSEAIGAEILILFRHAQDQFDLNRLDRFKSVCNRKLKIVVFTELVSMSDWSCLDKGLIDLLLPMRVEVATAHKAMKILLREKKQRRSLYLLSYSLSEQFLPDIKDLPLKELDVLNLLKFGFSNKRIADELGLSTHTVKARISRIYSQLNLRSRTCVAKLAAYQAPLYVHDMLV